MKGVRVFCSSPARSLRARSVAELEIRLVLRPLAPLTYGPPNRPSACVHRLVPEHRDLERLMLGRRGLKPTATQHPQARHRAGLALEPRQNQPALAAGLNGFPCRGLQPAARQGRMVARENAQDSGIRTYRSEPV